MEDASVLRFARAHTGTCTLFNGKTMINWFRDILKTGGGAELIEWRTQDSIYSFLSANINADGKLIKKANDLPDEVRNYNEIKFAP